MYNYIVRNVNEAFYYGTKAIKDNGRIISSRGKVTLELPEPFITEYMRPEERVLFCAERDANPFLHLFESLWMLAGRQDLRFLERLTKNFRQFSDDGYSMQGSYGWRWRQKFGFDQIWTIINLLRNNPDSRRAVLTMWSPSDLNDIKSSDIPCNTNVYFKIRDNRLNMTVCNRSNDMLWGAYGANVVHMSILQEYIANKIGCSLGRYIQMSDSFHVYTEDEGGKIWNTISKLSVKELWRDLYFSGLVEATPLGAYQAEWDMDLEVFFNMFDNGQTMEEFKPLTKWWFHVAKPMWLAYIHRDPLFLVNCSASDWRFVAKEWLERRIS